MVRLFIFRLIAATAVWGVLYVSLPEAAERALEVTAGKAIQTLQPSGLKHFTAVRDGTQVIHLPAGVYKMSTTLFLPSNTVLEGEGDATILKVDASFVGSQVITNSDYANGNRNIFIRNVRMEVALPQLPGYDPGIVRFRNVNKLEIDNVTMVIDSPMTGIDLAAQIRNATVQGCAITNTNKVSGGGISVRNGDSLPGRDTSDIVVKYNVVESARDEAISVFGWEGMVKNVRIENNTIRARGASFGIAAYGIDSPEQSGRLSGVDITGNSIEGSTVGGIGVMGGAEQINVVGNTVTNTTQDGIFIYPGGDGSPPPPAGVSVAQNSISNIGRHGIFASGVDVQLEQNDIANCAEGGIYAAAGVSIIGNVINVAHPGILVEAKSSAIIRDNVLTDAWEIVYLH
jgi:hypothetical protein